MADNVKAIVYPVKDVDKAKALYTALFDTPPAYDTPYYVGWSIDGQDLGLDPHGFENGITSPIAYVGVADIKARVDSLVAQGATVVQEIKDVGGGGLIATLKDADGNVIGLKQ